MGVDSNIEWTHHTFNPVLGCAKVHAGCTNCYAEKDMAVVMRKGGRINWGEVWQGGRRVVAADSTWKNPLTWARAAAKAGERRRVFCASLADVLEVPKRPESWPRDWTPGRIEQAIADTEASVRELSDARERLWPIIEDTAWMCGGCGRPCAHSSDTPHRVARLLDLASVGAACEGKVGRCLNTPMGGLDFLLLTKRPENSGLVPLWARPLVWLGTSISDQETADEWVPRLLAADGFRYRFLSVEPMLGTLDLSRWLFAGHHPSWDGHAGTVHQSRPSWVIVGGESGPKARPCNVEWVRSIVHQCRESMVPCFVKQLGACYSDPENGVAGSNLRIPDVASPLLSRRLSDPKGGDWDEWPDDLRVRQFPGDVS